MCSVAMGDKPSLPQIGYQKQAKPQQLYPVMEFENHSMTSTHLLIYTLDNQERHNSLALGW